MNYKQESFEIFPWNDNFNTGIKIIDEQHQVLVQILNKLASHLANYASVDKLNKIFDELANYTNYHFKTEEKIWSKYFKDDPWFIEHKKKHRSFILEILDLKRQDRNKNLDDVINDIVSFLTKWLAYHILDTDKRMANVVKRLKEGKSIEQAKESSNNEMSGSRQVLIDTVLSMYDRMSSRTMDLMREKALRQQAEKELSLSEERWNFILEGNGGGVWDWNMDEDNSSFLEDNTGVFNDSTTKLLDSNANSKIHPDDIDQVKLDFQTHIDGESEFYINKHRVIREDGHCCWVLSRGKVVNRDENNNPLRMIGTHLDVTEHELASLIYNESTQGMYITDKDNKIITTNPAFTEITGYTKEEVIGNNPHLFKSGKHDNLFYKSMWHDINDTGIWNGKIWNKKSNGEIYLQATSISTVKDIEGNLNQHLVLFTNITEEASLNKILKRSQKMESLGNLTGGIAHDFNNVLGIIKGYAEILEYSLSENNSLLEYISQISHATERGVNLTNKLLTFSRQSSPQTTCIDVNRLLEKRNLMLRKALTVRIKLDYNLSKDLWSVSLNENNLEDCLLNLCINAMHAIKGRGLITISTKNKIIEKENSMNLKAGNYVILQVKDNGSGIDATIIEQIFDPFFSTKGSNGTGLGLSQVYGFVKGSGGSIIVDSKLSLGTEFTIYFPRCDSNEKNTNEKVDDSIISFEGKEKILVVDDEKGFCNMTCDMLTQQGYTVFTANNAEQALEVLKCNKIHLMLSDVIMHEINGFELAKIVQSKFPEIKIQMVSGYIDEKQLDKIDSSLRENILLKPYSFTDLYKNIQILFDENMSK